MSASASSEPVRESAVTFGAERSLVGVLSEPGGSARAARPAVILLNAGLVYRIGPNRLYVSLARRLAAAGHPVLRFDFSGIGDSRAAPTRASFRERAAAEVIEAMDLLAARCGAQAFVLVGICSGADVALDVARADARVSGAVLANGGVPGVEATEERLREANERVRARYYRGRIADPGSWLRLLSGRSNLRGVLQAARRGLGLGARRGLGLGARSGGSRPAPASAPPDSADRARGILDELSGRGVQLLFALADGSATWDLFDAALGKDAAPQAPGVRIERLTQCDHVFTTLAAQERLLGLICGWLADLETSSPRPRDAGETTRKD